MASHNECKQRNEPIRKPNWHQARENKHVQLTIGLLLLLIGRERGGRFASSPPQKSWYNIITCAKVISGPNRTRAMATKLLLRIMNSRYTSLLFHLVFTLYGVGELWMSCNFIETTLNIRKRKKNLLWRVYVLQRALNSVFSIC